MKRVTLLGSGPVAKVLVPGLKTMGTAVAARALEPLCQLWCIPGLRENRWSHAFKLLRA